MNASRDVNELNEVAENVGRDHRPAEEEVQQELGGGNSDGRHNLLLSKSRRAIHDLASALEQDSDR